MKLTRSRKSKKGRIEIIPMIDVMFFLLASFMLASLSMQHLSGINVNLTQGAADKIQSEKKISLTITRDNLIFLNDREVALDSLSSSLRGLLQKSEKTIIVISDQDAFQGVVMKAMLAARSAGAEHFSMVVKN